MNREDVIQVIASAISWEEMKRAKQMLCQWLTDHPKDTAMLDAGEVLTMAKEDMLPSHTSFIGELTTQL